MEDIDMSRLNW